MRGLLLTAPLLVSMLLTGCGESSKGPTYKSQIQTQAPKSSLEISDYLIASGVSEEEASQLMLENPQARIRPLGHKSFEFRGLTKRQILEASPTAVVEKNAFMQFKKQTQHRAEDFIAKTLGNNELADEFAPGNCETERLLRVPETQIFTPKFSKELQVGESFKVNLKRQNDLGLTAWYIAPPMGSKLNIQFEPGDDILIKPDMPGTYGIAVFFKKNGRCNMTIREVTVTLNEPFQPELSKQDIKSLKQLSNFNFKQLEVTGADKAQKLVTKTTKIVVAVIDSGVNYNHPALKRQMWTNPKEIPADGIDNDSNGYIDDVVGYDFENDDSMPMDDAGHGSHVAGLIAGDFMGTGNMPNVKIMALKIGSTKGFDLSSIVLAINYAVENGADIINMSFGGPNESEAIKASIARAEAKGVLVVAAAGNGDHRGVGVDNDVIPLFPASYELSNILAIAAAEPDRSLTRYSNFGRREVDLAAIGGHSTRADRRGSLLYSAHLQNPSHLPLEGMAGTSMATPVTVGIAALILTEKPELSPSEVINVLLDTGKRSPFLKGLIGSESIIDAEAALLFLSDAS